MGTSYPAETFRYWNVATKPVPQAGSKYVVAQEVVLYHRSCYNDNFYHFLSEDLFALFSLLHSSGSSHQKMLVFTDAGCPKEDLYFHAQSALHQLHNVLPVRVAELDADILPFRRLWVGCGRYNTSLRSAFRATISRNVATTIATVPPHPSMHLTIVKRLHSRRIINIMELETMLTKAVARSTTVVVLEQMTFVQQVQFV